MYKEMTKDLQDNIISALAESDNSSLSSLKNMAKKYGVDVSQVLTIHKRNKGRIIALKNSAKTQQSASKETVNSMGNGYMIINTN
jgi:DNA repair ATPase RecN